MLEREKNTGTFSADLFAEGPNGETVVIENQLEKTDHDHLGKLNIKGYKSFFASSLKVGVYPCSSVADNNSFVKYNLVFHFLPSYFSTFSSQVLSTIF